MGLLAVILVAAGVIECFFGYRLFKFILGVIGFLFCGLLAATVTSTLSNNELVALGVGLIGGIIGAPLFIALYFVGVFVLGANLGALLSLVGFEFARTDPIIVVVIVVAVLVGALAVAFQKLMIVVATAFGGAWMAVEGVAYFVVGAGAWNWVVPAAGPSLTAMFAGWLVLGLAGVVVQIGDQRRRGGAPARTAMPIRTR